MATCPWEPTSEDIAEVRAFLRGPLCAARPASTHWLPALHDVLATHIEDGFVHLSFVGWPVGQARMVADQLLHPDAMLVSAGLIGRAAPAFEGFGWDEEPPAAVLARPSQLPGPPSLHLVEAAPALPMVRVVEAHGQQPSSP